jgi:hypothetical protein
MARPRHGPGARLARPAGPFRLSRPGVVTMSGTAARLTGAELVVLRREFPVIDETAPALAKAGADPARVRRL